MKNTLTGKPVIEIAHRCVSCTLRRLAPMIAAGSDMGDAAGIRRSIRS
jgi:hypothetical protein